MSQNLSSAAVVIGALRVNLIAFRSPKTAEVFSLENQPKNIKFTEILKTRLPALLVYKIA